MTAPFEKLTRVPWIAHWLRAVDRFNTRLGGQFAAAITYFSILSMVPILMVAFAALGLTITTLVPDVLETIKETVTEVFTNQGELGKQLVRVIEQAFGSWQAVGTLGLLIACWTGSTWVANLRSAIRVMTRPSADMTLPPVNIVIQTLKDLLLLFGLLLLGGISVALSSAATSARPLVSSLLRLDRVPGSDLLLSLVPVVGSLLAFFVVFLALFRIFPENRVPTATLVKGSLIGSAGTTVLQYAAGLIITAFNNNPTAAVFGNVIVTMIVFNMFAMLILVVAAWMATVAAPAGEAPVIVTASDLPRQPTDYATKQLLAQLQDAGDASSTTPPGRRSDRALRGGVATGTLLGAATAWAAARASRPLAHLARRTPADGSDAPGEGRGGRPV